MKYRNYYCSPQFSEGEKIYFGSVNGVREIPMISAENLNDFEQLFHDAVDDYLESKERSKKKSNKGMIVAMAILIVIVLFAIITCPKKEQHVTALSDLVSEVFSQELLQGDNSDMAGLGMLLGNALITPVIKSAIQVDDYVLFSVGKLPQQGEEKTISVGAFGHVFTISREQLKQSLREALSDD